MATKILKWIGGATAIAQKDTLTFGGGFGVSAGSTVTTTLTAEDDSTKSVATSATGANDEAVRDTHIAQLQNSSEALFKSITWATTGTDAIAGTSKVAGVPFYASLAETSTGGTYTRALTTTGSGPNDWEIAVNWQSSTGGNSVPVNADKVKVIAGSHDILYGLRPGNGIGNQGGATLDLKSFRTGQAYNGQIGNLAASYYLKVDVSDTSGSNTPSVVLNSKSPSQWLDGRMPNVWVTSTILGLNVAKLKGDIDNLRVVGAGVLGTVDVADASVLDNVYLLGANSASVLIGENVTSLDLFEHNSGTLETKSGGTTINSAGGTFIYHAKADEPVTTVNNRGGTIQYNGSGTLTKINNYAGTFDARLSEAAAVEVTNAEIWSGLIIDRGGLANVDYVNNIIVHGGDVQTDTGETIDPSVG